MKKCLLLCVLALLTGGCPHHSSYFYDHEVSIILKNGVPCFGLVDDEQIRSGQYKIFTVVVLHNNANWTQTLVMSKNLEGKTLPSGECIPYEGRALESNVLYGVSIGGHFVKQRFDESHHYSGGFCFSENKNGERVLHHFNALKPPASCPSNDEE